MTELVPRRSNFLTSLRDADLVSPPLPRAAERAIAAEASRGLVRAARVQAAGYVAATALTQLELLGHVEAAVAKRDPVSAERAAGFIDDFVFVARHELRKMAGGW
jgi:hypothetical protein